MNCGSWGKILNLQWEMAVLGISGILLCSWLIIYNSVLQFLNIDISNNTEKRIIPVSKLKYEIIISAMTLGSLISRRYKYALSNSFLVIKRFAIWTRIWTLSFLSLLYVCYAHARLGSLLMMTFAHVAHNRCLIKISRS